LEVSDFSFVTWAFINLDELIDGALVK
jgi:hypothetical protein